MLITALWLEHGHKISHSIAMLARESAYQNMPRCGSSLHYKMGLRDRTAWCRKLSLRAPHLPCCTSGKHLGSLSWLAGGCPIVIGLAPPLLSFFLSSMHPIVRRYLLSTLPKGLFTEDDEASTVATQGPQNPKACYLDATTIKRI